MWISVQILQFWRLMYSAVYASGMVWNPCCREQLLAMLRGSGRSLLNSFAVVFVSVVTVTSATADTAFRIVGVIWFLRSIYYHLTTSELMVDLFWKVLYIIIKNLFQWKKQLNGILLLNPTGWVYMTLYCSTAGTFYWLVSIQDWICLFYKVQ